jgi:hypothetical protein
VSLKHLARQALSMPLQIAVAKIFSYVGRILKGHVRQVTERHRCSYQSQGAGAFNSFLNGLKGSLPNGLAGNILAHRFDLLGSGWVNVAHTPDVGQLSPGNRERSTQIRTLIASGYSPIDWQLDFKSGYRWREDRLSETLPYGHQPGVDVKVPWELARLQHLPWLAMSGDAGCQQEFRNQVLDFAAANPPGYGVNWMCTMDVAIRAANVLIAYDLFVGQGAEFDDAFLSELHALTQAHGNHIMANLEWHDLHRGNHYLANICGLLFVAAYLPKSAETEPWLAFSGRQLIIEVERQFTPDGANFEASTSYHRLSSEMAIYTTALALGQDDGPEFPPLHFEALERMAEFIMHVTKPGGRIAQIGDNDSGRFFKLCPLPDLDHRATVAAINGLFERADLADFAGPETSFETSVVSALAGGQKRASYLKAGDSPRAVGLKIEAGEISNLPVIAETIISLPDASVLDGLTAFAYPDFGLYIWRSPRCFLSLRCGPIGQNGNGGHAHNDQLAIELNIDGEDWIADPGSYLYTPAPKDRDAYRSVHAHSAPKIGEGEPASLNLGLFRLQDTAQARTLSFGPDGLTGMHSGFGVPVHRCIEFQAAGVRIIDRAQIPGQPQASPVTVTDGQSLRQLWSLDLPFSPAYGLRESRAINPFRPA